MEIEANLYVRNRHSCKGWILLGGEELQSGVPYSSDFFPKARVTSEVNGNGFCIVFLNDPRGTLRGRYIEINGSELTRRGDVNFPTVLEAGEGVEIYSGYKSMDILFQPATIVDQSLADEQQF